VDYPGNLFVVAAPSGAGKSSLVKALRELDTLVFPPVHPVGKKSTGVNITLSAITTLMP
jgi:ABC-type iron transport system FetAB ATPase subunit